MSDRTDSDLKLAEALAVVIDRLKWDGIANFTLTFTAERPFARTVEIMDVVLTHEPHRPQSPQPQQQ